MRQTNLFTKTNKSAPKDEVSINAQLLERAGFVYKNSAGVYTLLPLGWAVVRRIEEIVREEMNSIGGQEMLMPALHDKHYLKATGRWDVDVVFKVADNTGKDPQYNISWTHEEIISEIAARYISSYKDLPFSTYQIQTKFRNEPRAKSGLLRGKEFIMKDLYSFHTDEKDLDEYYEKVKQAYFRVFERCGLKTYYTLAAGGDFTTNYTHEFQVICPVGEDIIYACGKCEYAENKEVSKLKEGSKCPECKGEIKQYKSVEVGNIFRYGTKYSEPFNLQYTGKNGEKNYVVSGAYGIGISRLMATVVEVCHDEKGIIWPGSIAPFDVHLLALNRNNAEVMRSADSFERSLLKKGIELLYDDRDASAGVKLSDSDLIGVPYRLVVSEKTVKMGKVELKERQGKTVLLSESEALETIAKSKHG